MGISSKTPEPRVSARVNEMVRTPIGDVMVTYGSTSGELLVSYHSDYPSTVRYDVTSVDGDVNLRVWRGRRPPAIGDEVTQNGRTFEVSGVRSVEGGRYQVMGDDGTWELWQEGR